MNINQSIAEVTRPKELDDIVGMEHNKKIIHYDIQGCLKLGDPIPSYLIVGAAGTGKSSLANVIANNSGGTIYKYLGAEIKKPDHIYDMAQRSKDNDVIYIEEAHGLNKSVQTILLEWIENFKLLNGGEVGVDAPKTSFVFPTTSPARIAKPLRERCRTLYTNYYSLGEMETILINAATKYGMDLVSDMPALRLLAQSSRGTPRTGIMHRLNALRKIMAVDDLPYCYDTVEYMLRTTGVNEYGLETGDLKYLETVYEKMIDNMNRPVAHKIIAQATGYAQDMIDTIEPYLHQINAIKVVPQGRVITAFGCALLNKQPILISQYDVRRSKNINLDELKEFIKDPAVRKQGLRAVAEKFKLKYPNDNFIMQAALAKIGAEARKKVGIIYV